MAEHYTANTESVTRWCNRCNRPTQHTVSGGRVGRCLEHDAPQFSKKQALAAREREPEPVRPALREGEGLGRNITTQLAKAPQPEGLAPCGDPSCAGCYEVQPGVRIHPPRSDW